MKATHTLSNQIIRRDAQTVSVLIQTLLKSRQFSVVLCEEDEDTITAQLSQITAQRYSLPERRCQPCQDPP